MIVGCEEIKKRHLNCIIFCDNRSKIVAKEEKRTYILNNSSRQEVCLVKIDNCLISSQDTKKCDYMVIICETEDIYFIELKGRDLLHAVKQLSQTIDFFKNEIKGKIFARIVVTKVNKPKAVEVDAKVVQLRKKLKKYGGNLNYAGIIYDRDEV